MRPSRLRGRTELQGAARPDDLPPFLALFDVVKSQHINEIRAQLRENMFKLVLRILRRARLELHANGDFVAARAESSDEGAQAILDAAPVEEIDSRIDGVPYVVRRKCGIVACCQAETANRPWQHDARTAERCLEKRGSFPRIVHGYLRAYCSGFRSRNGRLYENGKIERNCSGAVDYLYLVR